MYFYSVVHVVYLKLLWMHHLKSEISAFYQQPIFIISKSQEIRFSNILWQVSYLSLIYFSHFENSHESY